MDVGKNTYIKSNWIKRVNSVLNTKNFTTYIATDPRIETRGNTKKRKPKERWMYELDEE